MFPQYILSDNGTEFKNSLMDQVLQQLGIDRISLLDTTPKVTENWKSSQVFEANPEETL